MPFVSFVDNNYSPRLAKLFVIEQEQKILASEIDTRTYSLTVLPQTVQKTRYTTARCVLSIRR